MIYQCYPKKENQKNLFQSDPYVGFGLEPDVNEDLFLNCPELEDPFVRMQLTEYACFLWHWRNDEGDDWFGTTSHRQLEKFPFKFDSKEQVDALIKDHGVVAWGEYNLLNRFGVPISLKRQTQACHPGLNEYMEKVLSDHGYKLPVKWGSEISGFFANYWVMRKDLFTDFMEFSWPMVKWSLENVKDSDYYKKQTTYGTVSNAKATGYFMERLFLIWYLNKNIKPYNPSVASPLAHGIL